MEQNISAMWNCRSLTPPLYCELKTSLGQQETGPFIGARNYLKQSESALHDHLELLRTEVYVTRRIIYKLKNQFRSDKALHTLSQVNACLKRLEKVNLKKQFKDAMQLVKKAGSKLNMEIYLPSRQVLEYQLVLLQGTSALLRQTVQYCLKTFIHVKEHLELGNMIQSNLVMLALVSRLWFVCNSLGLYVCKWYSSLYPCLISLKPTAVSWLKDEVLPQDLSKWLTNMFEKIGLPEHFCTELEKVAESELKNGTLPSNVEFLPQTNSEDLGEPIKRMDMVPEAVDFTDLKLKSKKIDISSKRKSNSDDVTITSIKKQRLSDENQNTRITSVDKALKLIDSDSDGIEIINQMLVDLSDDEGMEETLDVNVGESADLDNAEKVFNVEHSLVSKSVDTNPKLVKSMEKEIKENAQKGVNSRDTKQIDVKTDTVDIKNVESLKAYLENVLTSPEDVDKFAEQVKTGTVDIDGRNFKLSKGASKKIAKPVEKLQSNMQASGSAGKKHRHFVKKACGPISELLVKHCQYNKGPVTTKKKIIENTQQSSLKEGNFGVDNLAINRAKKKPTIGNTTAEHLKGNTGNVSTKTEMKTSAVVNIGQRATIEKAGETKRKKKKNKRKKSKKISE